MKVLRGLLVAAYPLLVYAGLRYLDPRQVALAVALVFALRAFTRWRRPSPEALRSLAPPALLLGAVLAGTLWWNDARFLLLVPVLVNLALLAAFGRTLRGRGPTLVETFARLQDGDLSQEQVAYCRGVTRVWCLFFGANAAVSLWLALRADTEWWALYTGGIAYLLAGLLFAAEFAVRTCRFGRNRRGVGAAGPRERAREPSESPSESG